MSNDKKNNDKKYRVPVLGITWYELVVIIFIIGVLIALLLPARVSPSAWNHRRRVNQFTAIARAMQKYHEEHGSFPPAYTVDAEGKRLHSWRVLLLPYLDFGRGELSALYDRIKLDEPWDSEHNQQFHDKMPFWFLRPGSSDKQPKTKTSIKVVIGPDTVFPGAECRKLDDITRKKEDTILVVETKTEVCWMEPVDLPVEALANGVSSGLSKKQDGIGNFHRYRGAIVCMADGTLATFGESKTPGDIRKLQEAVTIR